MRKAAAAVAVLAALVVPAVAHAHPRVVSSTPVADAVLRRTVSVVSLRFDEVAAPVGSGLTVTGPGGREVTTGPVERHGLVLSRTVDATLHGSYVVEWFAVGADTHPARGAFVFSLGGTSRASIPGGGRVGTALQAVGRFISLAGFALGFGVPFAAAVGGGMTRRLWRLVGCGIAAMVVAEPVSLLGQTATLVPSHPFSTRLAGDVLLTSYGHVTGLRLGAALALWAGVGAVRGASPRALWAIPVLGGLVAFVHVDAAHRIAGLPGIVSLVLVATHVAAAGAWFGCVAVAVAGPRGAASRLAPFAVVAATLAVTTGIGLSVGHVRSLHELVGWAYGLGVLTKVAVVGLSFALGALGRRRLELAAAFGALAAAGVLASLLPPV